MLECPTDWYYEHKDGHNVPTSSIAPDLLLLLYRMLSAGPIKRLTSTLQCFCMSLELSVCLTTLQVL